MIPPTASLNRGIKLGSASDGFADDGEQSARSEENLSEMTTSSSEEEDSACLTYVDKNPVLSGLSCFTACPERSAVAADNERHDLKHAKRSLEEA